MNAETIAILKENAQSDYCAICRDYPPYCYCNEIDYEAEERHVIDFYQAIDEGDFEKAENHLMRISQIFCLHQTGIESDDCNE